MITAWMPGEAKYVTATIERVSDLKALFRATVEMMQEEMGGAPDEWRWELDGGVVVLAAARAL